MEDEPADVYLIRRAIADCCPQSGVWRVASGSDAPAFLRREPPFGNAPTLALILLDLNLPQLDGRSVRDLVSRLGMGETPRLEALSFPKFRR